jgi:hypothetical protein
VKDCCSLCEFWHPDTGTCRRYPPQLTATWGGNNAGSYFPSTKPSTWCGEFKTIRIKPEGGQERAA